MPKETRLLAKLYTHNIINIIPTTLKSKPDDSDCCIVFHVMLNNKSMGSVPKAKLSIVNHHDKKLCVESVYTCIDWVNPQGRKNVPTPISRGQRNELSLIEKCLKIFHQNAIHHLITHSRFSHKIKRTAAIIILSIILTFWESWKVAPIIHSTPPRIKNPTSLPIWKSEWGTKEEFFEYTAQRAKTTHHTTARQLDTDAISQIINDVP